MNVDSITQCNSQSNSCQNKENISEIVKIDHKQHYSFEILECFNFNFRQDLLSLKGSRNITPNNANANRNNEPNSFSLEITKPNNTASQSNIIINNNNSNNNLFKPIYLVKWITFFSDKISQLEKNADNKLINPKFFYSFENKEFLEQFNDKQREKIAEFENKKFYEDKQHYALLRKYIKFKTKILEKSKEKINKEDSNEGEKFYDFNCFLDNIYFQSDEFSKNHLSNQLQEIKLYNILQINSDSEINNYKEFLFSNFFIKENLLQKYNIPKENFLTKNLIVLDDLVKKNFWIKKLKEKSLDFCDLTDKKINLEKEETDYSFILEKILFEILLLDFSDFILNPKKLNLLKILRNEKDWKEEMLKLNKACSNLIFKKRIVLVDIKAFCAFYDIFYSMKFNFYIFDFDKDASFEKIKNFILKYSLNKPEAGFNGIDNITGLENNFNFFKEPNNKINLSHPQLKIHKNNSNYTRQGNSASNTLGLNFSINQHKRNILNGEVDQQSDIANSEKKINDECPNNNKLNNSDLSLQSMIFNKMNIKNNFRIIILKNIQKKEYNSTSNNSKNEMFSSEEYLNNLNLFLNFIYNDKDDILVNFTEYKQIKILSETKKPFPCKFDDMITYLKKTFNWCLSQQKLVFPYQININYTCKNLINVSLEGNLNCLNKNIVYFVPVNFEEKNYLQYLSLLKGLNSVNISKIKKSLAERMKNYSSQSTSWQPYGNVCNPEAFLEDEIIRNLLILCAFPSLMDEEMAMIIYQEFFNFFECGLKNNFESSNNNNQKGIGSNFVNKNVKNYERMFYLNNSCQQNKKKNNDFDEDRFNNMSNTPKDPCKENNSANIIPFFDNVHKQKINALIYLLNYVFDLYENFSVNVIYSDINIKPPSILNSSANNAHNNIPHLNLSKVLLEEIILKIPERRIKKINFINYKEINTFFEKKLNQTHQISQVNIIYNIFATDETPGKILRILSNNNYKNGNTIIFHMYTENTVEQTLTEVFYNNLTDNFIKGANLSIVNFLYEGKEKKNCIRNNVENLIDKNNICSFDIFSVQQFLSSFDLMNTISLNNFNAVSILSENKFLYYKAFQKNYNLIAYGKLSSNTNFYDKNNFAFPTFLESNNDLSEFSEVLFERIKKYLEKISSEKLNAFDEAHKDNNSEVSTKITHEQNINYNKNLNVAENNYYFNNDNYQLKNMKNKNEHYNTAKSKPILQNKNYLPEEFEDSKSSNSQIEIIADNYSNVDSLHADNNMNKFNIQKDYKFFPDNNNILSCFKDGQNNNLMEIQQGNNKKNNESQSTKNIDKNCNFINKNLSHDADEEKDLEPNDINKINNVDKGFMKNPALYKDSRIDNSQQQEDSQADTLLGRKRKNIIVDDITLNSSNEYREGEGNNINIPSLRDKAYRKNNDDMILQKDNKHKEIEVKTEAEEVSKQNKNPSSAKLNNISVQKSPQPIIFKDKNSKQLYKKAHSSLEILNRSSLFQASFDKDINFTNHNIKSIKELDDLSFNFLKGLSLKEIFESCMNKKILNNLLHDPLINEQSICGIDDINSIQHRTHLLKDKINRFNSRLCEIGFDVAMKEKIVEILQDHRCGIQDSDQVIGRIYVEYFEEFKKISFQNFLFFTDLFLSCLRDSNTTMATFILKNVYFELYPIENSFEENMLEIKKTFISNHCMKKLINDYKNNLDLVYYFIAKFFEEEKKFARNFTSYDYQRFCDNIFFWTAHLHYFINANGLSKLLSVNY